MEKAAIRHKRYKHYFNTLILYTIANLIGFGFGLFLFAFVDFEPLTHWEVWLGYFLLCVFIGFVLTLETIASEKSQVKRLDRKPLKQFQEIGFEKQGKQLIGSYQNYPMTLEWLTKFQGEYEGRSWCLQITFSDLQIPSSEAITKVYYPTYSVYNPEAYNIQVTENQFIYQHNGTYQPTFEQLTYRIEKIISLFENEQIQIII